MFDKQKTFFEKLIISTKIYRSSCRVSTSFIWNEKYKGQCRHRSSTIQSIFRWQKNHFQWLNWIQFNNIMHKYKTNVSKIKKEKKPEKWKRMIEMEEEDGQPSTAVCYWIMFYNVDALFRFWRIPTHIVRLARLFSIQRIAIERNVISVYHLLFIHWLNRYRITFCV